MITRIEEFRIDDKIFVYINMSGITDDNEFYSSIENTKQIIAQYPKQSLYTIVNLENIKLDSTTKDSFMDYTNHNAPYVKHCAVIGVDGVQKLMVGTAMKQSGRAAPHFAYTKDDAIEWLLKQD